MRRRLLIRCLPLAWVLALTLAGALPTPPSDAHADEKAPTPAAPEERLTSGRAGAVLRALDRHVRALGDKVRIEDLALGVQGVDLRGTASSDAALEALAAALARDADILRYLARDAVEPSIWRSQHGQGQLPMSMELDSAMKADHGLPAGAQPLGVDAGLDRIAKLAENAGLAIEPPYVDWAVPYKGGIEHVSAKLTLRTRVSRTGPLPIGKAERAFVEHLDDDPALRATLYRGDIRVVWQVPKDETNSALGAGTWEAGPVVEAIRSHADAMGNRVRLLGFSTHLGIRVSVDVASELALTDLRERLRVDPAVRAFIGKLRVRDVLRSYQLGKRGRARAELMLHGNLQPYIPGSGLTQATDSRTALDRIASLAQRAGVAHGKLRTLHAYEYRDGRVYANTWIPVESIGATELELLRLIANDPTLCAPDAHWAEEPSTELRYKGSKPGNGIAVLWRLDAEAEARFHAKRAAMR